jgi:hypothetical protein
MYEAALTLSVACLILASSYFVRQRCFNIYHPLTTYTAIHALIFVIRPILGYFLHYNSVYQAFEFMPTVEDKTTVIVAANVAYLCFFYWSLYTGGVPMHYSTDAHDNEERRRLTQVFIWVLVLLGPVALYSLYNSYSALSGGEYVKGMVMDKSTGISYNTSSNGYITDAQNVLAPCCALILWLGKFRPASWIPILGYAVLKSGTGGRGSVVMALVMAALFYCYDHRSRFPPMKALGVAVSVVIAFNAVGADRGATLREWMGQEVTYDKGDRIAEVDKQKFMEGMDFANMEFFEYLVYVIPDRSGTYDYFLDNFQIFTDPVPRVLWSGKPMGEPFRRIWLWDFGSPIGMTRSIPGEGWYAAGWLGVVVWASLWGAMLGTLYRRFAQSRQSTISVACFMIFSGGLITTYRDGQALTLVRNSGMYLAPIFVWYWVGRYLGLPKAAELRGQAAKLLRLSRAKAVGDGVEEPAAPLSHLPAAVRRRRLALAQQSGERE